MPNRVSYQYQVYLIEFLKDPNEASVYFKAVLEEQDVEPLAQAINNLIEADYNNLAKFPSKKPLHKGFRVKREPLTFLYLTALKA